MVIIYSVSFSKVILRVDGNVNLTLGHKFVSNFNKLNYVELN